NGSLHGIVREYDLTGKLKRCGTYKYGKFHGIYCEFHQNGIKATEATYSHNIRTKYTKWDNTGKKIKEIIYNKKGTTIQSYKDRLGRECVPQKGKITVWKACKLPNTNK